MILWNVLYLTITMTTNCQEDDTNSKLSEKMPAKSWFLMVLRLLLICRNTYLVPINPGSNRCLFTSVSSIPGRRSRSDEFEKHKQQRENKAACVVPKMRVFICTSWMEAILFFYIKNWTTDIRSLAFSLARQTQVISTFTCITKYGQCTRHQIKKTG